MTEKEFQKLRLRIMLARWGGKPPPDWVGVFYAICIFLLLSLLVIAVNTKNGAPSIF